MIMIEVGIVLAAFIIFFTGGLWMSKSLQNDQWGRKFAHIGSGLTASALPWFVDLRTALIMGSVWCLILWWLVKNKEVLFSSQNKSKKGVWLFPLGLTITAGLFWHKDPLIFQAAALILGLADGLAGLAGGIIGKMKYKILGEKTWEGSLVFLIITLTIMFSLFNERMDWKYLCLSTVLITMVEGVLSDGWDNLAVPVFSGMLIYYFIYV